MSYFQIGLVGAYSIVAFIWACVAACNMNPRRYNYHGDRIEDSSPDHVRMAAKMFLIFPVWPVTFVWFIYEVIKGVVRAAVGAVNILIPKKEKKVVVCDEDCS